MYQAATIAGQKYKAEAKYIDMPISEWYVPPATDQMDFNTLLAYKNKLADQIAMWEGYFDGANKREAKNLEKILSVQYPRLEGYISRLEKITPGATDGGNPQDPGGMPATDPPQAMPPTKQPNFLMIGAAAIAAILLLKK